MSTGPIVASASSVSVAADNLMAAARTLQAARRRHTELSHSLARANEDVGNADLVYQKAKSRFEAHLLEHAKNSVS